MKSMRLQKSQFLNFSVNWKKFGSATQAYIEKIQFSIFFMNWEKMRNSAKATFKIPKSLCELGKTWENSLKPTLKKFQF